MDRNSTFDEAAAKKWIASVNGLNETTDDLLQKVATCIADIKSESEGPMVEALTQVAAGLTTGFKELVSSLKELVVALKKVVTKFREMTQAVVDGIKGAAKKMIGGVEVTVSGG